MTRTNIHVLITFMSDAARKPAEACAPAANRAAPTAPARTNIARVLAAITVLISFGRNLAAKLQNPADTSVAAAIRPFGRLSLDAILARIACGLRRAAALEERLHRIAGRGRDISVYGMQAKPLRTHAPAAPRAPRPKRDDPDGLPTAEQIAAEVRRRPIGAVIADICDDLGLTPLSCGPEFWCELQSIVFDYGGSFVRWIAKFMQRLGAAGEVLMAETESSSAAPPLPPHSPE